MTVADQIKQSVPMTRAAPFYGLHVRHDGFCCCPFHGEKTPSMKVYDGDKGFCCFGCHKGGSVIDFVMELYGLPFVDAEKRLDADFNLGLFTDDQTPEERQRAARAVRERKKAIEQRNRKHRALHAAYDAALTAYADADKLCMEAQELPPFRWSSAHCEALKAINGLWYDLQSAQTALSMFEHENHTSGALPDKGVKQ